ncbi:MAG: hypothetical protein LBI53_03870 [Candidatus Peribacteria bacterium]|jgi:hypothetical protein|nr:hypothetical protein [Candidatus Peribacteria bacterium]
MFDPSKRELLHNQYIKGVIFLDSNLLSDFLPKFKEKSRERQFINAAIDIIRGGSFSNKKENYIQEVVSYFNTNKRTLLKQIVNHRDPILKKRYLNIYLSNVSPVLDTFLQKNFLQTVYQEDTIYSWDINTAFNKSDAFIEKEVQLIGPNHQVLSSTVDNITSLKNLSP